MTIWNLWNLIAQFVCLMKKGLTLTPFPLDHHNTSVGLEKYFRQRKQQPRYLHRARATGDRSHVIPEIVEGGLEETVLPATGYLAEFSTLQLPLRRGVPIASHTHSYYVWDGFQGGRKNAKFRSVIVVCEPISHTNDDLRGDKTVRIGDERPNPYFTCYFKPYSMFPFSFLFSCLFARFVCFSFCDTKHFFSTYLIAF